jgi:hypothetical protein
LISFVLGFPEHGNESVNALKMEAPSFCRSLHKYLQITQFHIPENLNLYVWKILERLKDFSFQMKLFVGG